MRILDLESPKGFPWWIVQYSEGQFLETVHGPYKTREAAREELNSCKSDDGEFVYTEDGEEKKCQWAIIKDLFLTSKV